MLLILNLIQGIFISNYARNTVIQKNEFIWSGESAIAAVGSADLIDGLDGNYVIHHFSFSLHSHFPFSQEEHKFWEILHMKLEFL